MPDEPRYLVGDTVYTLIQRHRTIRVTTRARFTGNPVSTNQKYQTLEEYRKIAREIADRGTRI